MDLDQRVAPLPGSRWGDRVKHREGGNTLIGQFTHHRIDQERHVRARDFKDVAFQRAPARADAATNAGGLLIRRPLTAPYPEIVRQRGKVGSGQVPKLICGGIFVKSAQERLGSDIDDAVDTKSRPRPLRRCGDELVNGSGVFSARRSIHVTFP